MFLRISHQWLTSRPFCYYSLSTCEKSSSTGVSLPKIEISTLSFSFCTLTSSILPVKSVNGPATTLTTSSFDHFTFGLRSGASIASRIAWTSFSCKAAQAYCPNDTNPVTPVVLLTRYHVVSSKTISMST